jgi:hypothetical protein
MLIFLFIPFLLTAASQVISLGAENQTSASISATPPLSLSLLPLWKQQLKEKQARINGWIDMNADGAEKIMGFAVLLMVGRAFWVWGWRSWGFGRGWWEERERRERYRVWMVEEKKVRREMLVVGILKGEGWKGKGKRVSFEDGRSEGRIVGTVKREFVGEDMEKEMESAMRDVVAASEKLLLGAGMIELLASNGARS